MLSVALVVAVVATSGHELPLAPELPARAVVVVDHPWPPQRLELLPDGLTLATRWNRVGDRFVVSTRLPVATGQGAFLRMVARGGDRRAAQPPVLRGVVAERLTPLAWPEVGEVVALRLPERPSMRALLLTGALDDAVLLHGTERLRARLPAVPGRLLTLVEAGPDSTVIVAAPPGAVVRVRTATLHAGYPLPAPETFRVSPYRDGTFAFEVEARDHAQISFEAFDVRAPGEIEVWLEGDQVWTNPTALVTDGWSDVIWFELPAERFARGRDSLLEVRLSQVGGRARRDRGAGVRRLALSQELPAAGPFGPGVVGGGYPTGCRFTFRLERAGAHVVRFRVDGLLAPGELDWRLDGELLDRVGNEGGVDSRDVELTLPELALGTTHTLVLMRPLAAGEGATWRLRDVSVGPRFVAPVLPELAPPIRPSGPIPSDAPVGQPGAEPLSAPVAPVSGEPGLPGQAAEPVGTTDLFFGVPVLPLDPDGPPRVEKAPWAAEFESSVVLDPGPVFSGKEFGEPAGSDALPGREIFFIESRTDPRPGAPTMPTLPEPTDRAIVHVVTDPPGAAVFLARAGSYRGEFVGLTPVTIRRPVSGPVTLRIERAGYRPAELRTVLPPAGEVGLSRSLLPWTGIDFSRPIPVGSHPAAIFGDGYAAPIPSDIDGDGRVDLIVGTETGQVRWMRDVRRAGPPLFARPEPLRLADGEPLVLDGYAVPTAADWDGDGRVDLLVGGRSGTIHLFRRSAAQGSIVYEDGGELTSDGAALTVGNGAAPLVVDWDGDSRPDLLVGSGYGHLVLFRGNADGTLTQVAPVRQGEEPIEFLLDVVPIDLGDWTGDGLADLILADMYGNVWLYPGVSGPSEVPTFGPQRRVTHRGGLDLATGTYPHGFASDLDGDGYRDLFFGNASGELVWLRGGEPGEFDELEPVLVPDEQRRSGPFLR